ncbi:ACP S-malonyltransferase [Mycoplasmatota bacterium]|nr:ACP S-malonyltransferase [Mycoplasmatota bacterium]
MHKLAICFSGQGSQYEGMALDFLENDMSSKTFIQHIDQLLNESYIQKFNRRESMEDTSDVQPMIVLKSLLGLNKLDIKSYQVDAYFGFSLGEFSAYAAAGVFQTNDLIHIVKMRGYHMQVSSIEHPGSMAAIIGLDKEKVLNVITPYQKQGVIEIANENGYKQYVISGETKLIKKAILDLKESGARRAILLNVSGAFHTSMMHDASLAFKKSISAFKRKRPHTPILMNKNASWLKDDIEDHLINQMVSPVKFVEMIQRLKKDGYTHILEIGPGKVLTGLIKKIDSDIEVMSFDKYDSYENVKGWLENNGFKK